MRHLNKKRIFQGAGKSKPKPKPAVLNPPKIGNFKVSSSYSVAEIIDLISDGPIEGLVDQNGAVLNKDIFKGIYLDNTPIQNSQPAKLATPIGSIAINTPLNQLAGVFIQNNKLKQSLSGSSVAPSSFLAISATLISTNSFTKYSHAESIPNFPQVTWSSGLLSNFWNLTGATVYRENTFLLLHPFFTDFEARVKNIAASQTTSASKTFAENNFNNLQKFKQRISKNLHVPNNQFFQSFSIDRTGVYYSYVLTPIDTTVQELVGRNASTSISFNVDGLNDQRGLILDYFLQPEINDNNNYTGNIKGFLVISIPMTVAISASDDFRILNFQYDSNFLFAFNRSGLSIAIREGQGSFASENVLFNFSNVSAEFKKGEEFQSSLIGFENVINDYFYESKLVGPFDKGKTIQRVGIVRGSSIFADGISRLEQDRLLADGSTNKGVTRTNREVLDGLEGSNDIRSTSNDRLVTDAANSNNYSNWNDGNETKNLDAVSVTHTVENPFTEEVSVSVSINNLSDTTHVDFTDLKGIEGGKLSAGSKIPAIVILRIETGKIKEGEIISPKTYNYMIAGLIEGGCVVDFGGDYQDPNKSIEDTVRVVRDGVDAGLDTYLNKPFPLPSLEIGEDPTTVKRYVKITKLSAETNSVLINKDLTLLKVTEIIKQKLSYPFSALVGIKMDARAFGSIPERSYDCRLKRVKIPSNYFPLDGTSGADKRYISKASTYNATSQVYIGDWDGSFREGWTDNPAWILYDLLSSQRYGLGSHIEESQINKWELYKIARFCDAVDDLGFFVGVSDGVGGLEPRYSCNIIFKEQTKVYDAINVIANLFRGIVYFGNSEINFLDDRPRTPIALFSNNNVRDGVFNYGNGARDQKFNTVEVVYLDRFDNYKTKVEYIQDEEDIRKRGVFKTTINTSGVTSRAMARRIGQHIIYQTTKENQSVDFKTGLEALLCRPGDLIIIEDEMKTRASNFGKVLSVNSQNKSIRIDTEYLTGSYNGTITLYTPTGLSTSEELSDIANKNRARVDQFSITGLMLGDTTLSGIYRFSGYTSGIVNSLLNDQGFPIYPSEAPLYTGKSSSHGQDLFCYYNTGATGFVFATGRAFQDNNLYDKIITNTGVFLGVDFDPTFADKTTNFTGFVYNSAIGNKRGSSGAISGNIDWDSKLYPITNGILDKEIDTYNISQIAKISITGYDNLDYGSIVYLNQNDPNSNLLPIIKLGSVYRLERKQASDQIYKIIAIREEAQNEYGIAATKYNTGKFEEIEKFITEDFLPNTFNSNASVNNVDVRELNAPTIVSFSGVNATTSNFSLTGRWTSVTDATGYRVSVSNNLAGVFVNRINLPSQTGVLVTGQTAIGNWNLAVTALGNGSTRINSLTNSTGAFVAYSSPEITATDRPVVTKFNLL